MDEKEKEFDCNFKHFPMEGRTDCALKGGRDGDMLECDDEQCIFRRNNVMLEELLRRTRHPYGLDMPFKGVGAQPTAPQYVIKVRDGSGEEDESDD
jgi:hypothetical protein